MSNFHISELSSSENHQVLDDSPLKREKRTYAVSIVSKHKMTNIDKIKNIQPFLKNLTMNT